MIDDRDEYRNRPGQRIRHEGDLEGQNVRTHDEGMRVRGGGRDRDDTSRYGRSDDDRYGRGREDYGPSRGVGPQYRGDDDRGYSWQQDRDPSRFDEGYRGRSWDDARYGREDQARGMYGQDYGRNQDYGRGQDFMRNQYGGQDYGRGQSGYASGRDDDRDREWTGGGSGRGYQNNLAGTSGRLGRDPERDYGRGGPQGGGFRGGYGGREHESQYSERQLSGGQFRDYEGERGRYGGREPSRDFQAGGESFGRGYGGSSEDFGRSERSRSGPQRRGPMNYQRSDQRIYEDVCDCLSDDARLDVSEVEVKVDKGEVTLTGTVESRDMKRRLEDVIERVSGVKDINNQVKVQRHDAQTRGQGASQTTGSTSTGQSGSQTDKPNKPNPSVGHIS